MCGTTAYGYLDLECKGDPAETIEAPTDFHEHDVPFGGVRRINTVGGT